MGGGVNFFVEPKEIVFEIFWAHSYLARWRRMGIFWESKATFRLGSAPVQKECYRPFTKGAKIEIVAKCFLCSQKGAEEKGRTAGKLGYIRLEDLACECWYLCPC